MKSIQVGLIILAYDNNLFESKPLLDRNGFFYSVKIVRRSSGKEICSVFGTTIIWNEYPQGNNINQSKGLTTMTIV
jgi:hypothetical protein